MAYFKSSKDVYEKLDLIGDPRTEQWFLVKDWWPSVCISIAYLIFVKFFSQWMKDRPAINTPKLLVLYNITMVLMSIYITATFFFYGLQTGLNLSCWPVNKKINSSTMGLANTFWWFYFSKIIELVDTVFFITRKKYNLITPLHLYHHAIMPFLTWLGIKFAPGGFASITFMLNSFVHIFMYIYYALAAAGPEFRKYLFWKQYMTLLQITQFVFNILHCVNVLRFDCPYPKILIGAILSNCAVFLILFTHFYHTSYKSQSIYNKKD